MAPNAQRLREVAASHLSSLRATAAKIVFFFKRKVMPASCETARWAMWLPSLYTFKERYFFNQTSARIESRVIL